MVEKCQVMKPRWYKNVRRFSKFLFFLTFWIKNIGILTSWSFPDIFEIICHFSDIFGCSLNLSIVYQDVILSKNIYFSRPYTLTKHQTYWVDSDIDMVQYCLLVYTVLLNSSMRIQFLSSYHQLQPDSHWPLHTRKYMSHLA